ncbi:hypothetical protein [Streptomyces sp. MBT53]|uniref:hypothetical protein n=1 Tax=Streptomyces sp. MBT53 TaxID=1488384 RepID=UPI001911384F|nr:hypothetical protein [Streptomyces sp. MBT53]MBK6011711.1 hypothetical protein [Streptomyces sp. MBT53]
MQHRKLGFAAAGVAAAGLCAALATTALASSDHGSTAQNVKHAQTVVKEAAKPKAASDVKIKDQPSASELNRQLVKIQWAIKVTTGRPTKAQVAEADKLVGQLKAQGKATAAQLAWLALTPAEKRVEAAPVNVN